MRWMVWVYLWIPLLIESIQDEKLSCADKCNIPFVYSKDSNLLMQQQQLLHCNLGTTNNPSCFQFWNSSLNRYKILFRDHYEKLSVDSKHSVNTINRGVQWKDKGEHLATVDVVIDARCHHSWTINPYHRIADCLVLIVPPLFNYFSQNFSLTQSSKKVILLVDESTESLCDPSAISKSVKRQMQGRDQCIFQKFFSLLRTKFYYRCISTSNFWASSNWFRRRNGFGAKTSEYIALLEQKNPFTFGSGFDTIQKHPNYDLYLKEFQHILLDAFACNCYFEDNVASIGMQAQVSATQYGYLGNQSRHHNAIVFLDRGTAVGRRIPQQAELLRELETAIDEINSRLVEKQGHQFDDASFEPYVLKRYMGYESLCDTIALFWSGKVIVGAHGAGIINTVFSRPDSLLVEITPDKLDAKGEPWRMNAEFAGLNGLQTHVIVVPHNASATTERDLQVIYPLDISPYHIHIIRDIVVGFIMDDIDKHVHGVGVGTINDGTSRNIVTSLVDVESLVG